MSLAPGESVALLYGDVELNRHVHDALLERGVHIAYEGPVAEASADALREKDVASVVVNLESGDEDDLDHLDDVLEAGDWHVVFNDAEASCALSGWDRARWARHLVAKLVGGDAQDADPPRPPASEPATAPWDEQGGHADTGMVEQADVLPDVPASETVEAFPMQASYDDQDDAEPMLGDRPGVDLTVLSNNTGRVADDTADVALADVSIWDVALDADDSAAEPHEDAKQGDNTAPAWSLIDLDLAGHTGEGLDDVAPSAIGEMDALRSGAADVGGTAGLEMGLMPVVEPESADDDVGMFHEMRMDVAGQRIRRVVLIVGDGASMPAIAQLLATLAHPVAGLVLVVQHPQDAGTDLSAAALASMAGMPVKLVATESLARDGEVWLVPPRGSLRVLRDGHMVLLDDGRDTGMAQAQLDRTLEALAGVFVGEIAVVVMSGSGSDGLVGARLVVACGGEVWLDEHALAAADGLAHAIGSEGLATGSGSPAQLAECLAPGDP